MLVSVSSCTFCDSDPNLWAKIIKKTITYTFFPKKFSFGCIFNNYLSFHYSCYKPK